MIVYKVTNKITLLPHQVEALEKVKGRKRVALYLDMGLGKTFAGSVQLERFGNPTNLIIVQASKVDDWLKHFSTFHSEYKLFNLMNKKEFDKFFEENCAKVGIITYQTAWRRKELLTLKDFTLILDESSLIQNRTAKQSKFILKLCPSNVILLSGTPTSGKYENLWTQAHLLGWSISEQLYNQQYINWKLLEVFDRQTMNTRKVKVVDKENPYKNVERLKNKLRDYGAVFMKTEEVMTLPEQNFIDIFVTKSKLYKKFMEKSIVDVGEKMLVGDTSLTKRLYARQLCGVYSDEKLQAFRDFLQSTNDRVIVFYNFTDEAKKLIHIANELDRPWGIINGEQKNYAAYENYEDSVTFVQYQAGSMGLNLQKANKILYYSLPERSELFEQSKKRIHRIGQSKPCFYYIFKCKGTIEEDVHEALKQRKDYTDELFRERSKTVGG